MDNKMYSALCYYAVSTEPNASERLSITRPHSLRGSGDSGKLL